MIIKYPLLIALTQDKLSTLEPDECKATLLFLGSS